LSPALLLLLTVLAYPVGWEIWTSFTSYSPLQEGGAAFVGLQNYRQQIEDTQFWRTVTVTVVYTVVTITAKLTLGLGFALLLSPVPVGAGVWSFPPSSPPGPIRRAWP